MKWGESSNNTASTYISAHQESPYADLGGNVFCQDVGYPFKISVS